MLGAQGTSVSLGERVGNVGSPGDAMGKGLLGAQGSSVGMAEGVRDARPMGLGQREYSEAQGISEPRGPDSKAQVSRPSGGVSVHTPLTGKMAPRVTLSSHHTDGSTEVQLLVTGLICAQTRMQD